MIMDFDHYRGEQTAKFREFQLIVTDEVERRAKQIGETFNLDPNQITDLQNHALDASFARLDPIYTDYAERDLSEFKNLDGSDLIDAQPVLHFHHMLAEQRHLGYVIRPALTYLSRAEDLYAVFR